MFQVISRLLIALTVCLALQTSVPTFAAEGHGDPHAGGGEGAHNTSLPMDWRGDLALFSLVTFVIYVAVLWKAAWGPLQNGLNDRERGIKQNIADAEANRVKSESMLREYDLKLAKVQDEVREIIAEARRDADHVKQEIVATAQREAEATKDRAIAEIERSKDLALTELFDYVSNNVINATEHMIGRSLSSADQDRLVNESLAQLNVRRN